MKPLPRSSVTFSIYLINFLISQIGGEQVPLKCDELERSFEYKDIYCTVTNLKVTHSQEVKVSTYLNQQTTNIKFMKFYDTTLLYIPHKLFDSYPNLKNLDVAYSHVIDIPRNSFAGAEQLSYLNVSHNNLTEITTSVFIGAPNLLRIDLSYNEIVTINENAFKGLTILDRLTLSANRIKFLHKNLFADNIYIESVALDNNEIKTIDPELFNKLSRIRDLDLTNNQLSSIDPQIFATAYNVEQLFLSGNMLKKFSLETKNQVNTLYVDNNQLTTLFINSTKYVRADNNRISSIISVSSIFLEKLYLSNNSITDIQNITNFSSLTALDISYNNIGLINISTFSRLQRLKHLNLKSTNVVGIDYGTFSKQTNLEFLDISYNNFRTMNLDIFIPYLSKVHDLYIDGNNLTEIKGKSFSYSLPALSTIGLSNNHFNCSYLHQILTPPFLSTYVKLHIEPDTSSEGTTHIRGIACSSDEAFKRDYPNDIEPSRQARTIVNGEDIDVTLHKLLLHERQLEQHLIFMKILVSGFCLVAVSAVGYVIFRFFVDRKVSLVRSISFRSTATVNTLTSNIAE